MKCDCGHEKVQHHGKGRACQISWCQCPKFVPDDDDDRGDRERRVRPVSSGGAAVQPDGLGSGSKRAGL